ncbi:MAG: DeoR family transcriptional regulator [Pleomorphochaeta sp.]
MDKSQLSKRQEKILDAIKINPNIKVNEISDITNTAAATVRRDLNKLSQLNYIEKSYGKLSIIDPIEKRLIETNNSINEEQKSLIKKTEKQIHSGNVILLNYSIFNCKLIDELLITNKFATIVTNSLELFDRSKDSDKLHNILLAGLYNKELKTFSGTTTYSILSTLRADCFIMHPYSVDFELGFLANPTDDLQLTQYMINVARKVIIYIDEECISKTSGLLVAEFNLVNTVITTKKIYEKYKQELDLYDFNIIISD